MNGEFNLSDYQYNQDDWSKYQLMVLQQLDDHTRVLHNLNKEIITINQSIAVHQAEINMWKTQITSTIERMQEEMDDVLSEDKIVNQRMNNIEKEINIEEQSNIKTKATWALYGSIIMFVANMVVQIAAIIIKKP